ncbi:MAG: response regulator [Terracidiphilus sp.]|jgi:CheY-like chemotaxis protein
MSGGKTRILIVDDEFSIRTTLSLVLCEVGYSVTTAEDGLSALTSLRREIPDFLICDLHMPGMSGFELSSIVRRRFPQLRTIVMSGAFQGNEVPCGVAADAFFQKGSSLACLLKLIQSLQTEDGAISKPDSGASVPIWIQPSGYDRAGDAQFTICCPDCLRAFPVACGGLEGSIRETTCAHCRSRIHYSVVPTIDRVSAPAPQRNRNVEMLMPAKSSQYEN